VFTFYNIVQQAQTDIDFKKIIWNSDKIHIFFSNVYTLLISLFFCITGKHVWYFQWLEQIYNSYQHSACVRIANIEQKCSYENLLKIRCLWHLCSTFFLRNIPYIWKHSISGHVSCLSIINWITLDFMGLYIRSDVFTKRYIRGS
jgi:hypothetical protein